MFKTHTILVAVTEEAMTCKLESPGLNLMLNI